jgi:hypothetical protein
MARGLYRSRTRESEAEYAFVDYGVRSSLGAIPRILYDAQAYQPPFDTLPTKEQYEAASRREGG